MAADPGTNADQDRHVMRQMRFETRRSVDPSRWSRTGNDRAWPEALDRQGKCSDGMPPRRSRRPSRLNGCRYRACVTIRDGRVPTIEASVALKSP